MALKCHLLIEVLRKPVVCRNWKNVKFLVETELADSGKFDPNSGLLTYQGVY